MSNIFLVSIFVFSCLAIEHFDRIVLPTTKGYISAATSTDLLRQNKIEFEYPFRYRKYANARVFLSTYKSPGPVIILVEDNRKSRRQALHFLTDIYEISHRSSDIDFRLMEYNSSGISSILESTSNNKQRLLHILKGDLDAEISSMLGLEMHNKSAVYFAIINATYNLTENGAIIVFVETGANDEDLAQLALKEIEKRKIQLYVIWSSQLYDQSKKSTLKELTDISQGAFLINSYQDFPDDSYSYYVRSVLDGNTKIAAILSKKNLLGFQIISFPIDSNVTFICISVSRGISSGQIITANGYIINITDPYSVSSYSKGSFVAIYEKNGPVDIYLNNTWSIKNVGIWTLRINNTETPYNVNIFVQTMLRTNAVLTEYNKTDINQKKIIKLEITNNIKEINAVSLLRLDGKPIENLNVSLPQKLVSSDDDGLQEEQIVEIDLKRLPSKPFYALIKGKDVLSNEFSRLSYINYPNVDDAITHKPALTINLGQKSQLIVSGSSRTQIYFEITNNLNEPSFVRFTCRDEQYILQSMSRYFQWLSPGETTTVALNLITKPGPYTDHITFTANGCERITKEVMVDVDSSISDQDKPELYYEYTSDCSNVVFGKCSDGNWIIRVKAKDRGSGLLTLDSIPRGLYFPNNFISGTKEEVEGYYTGSCCNPKLQLIAIDRLFNYETIYADAYRGKLGPAAIAAIVLGVLLLILIILAIIYLCVKLCKKEKVTFELPTYRGPNSTSRVL